MEFPALLLVGIYWEINAKAGHGILGNTTGWISLRNKCYRWRWNFW